MRKLHGHRRVSGIRENRVRAQSNMPRCTVFQSCREIAQTNNRICTTAKLHTKLLGTNGHTIEMTTKRTVTALCSRRDTSGRIAPVYLTRQRSAIAGESEFNQDRQGLHKETVSHRAHQSWPERLVRPAGGCALVEDALGITASAHIARGCKEQR